MTRTSFKVKGQRSRSPDRLMLRLVVRHNLPNCRRAYKLQTWFTLHGVRRPVSPTSAMTTNVKGQGRDVTWCVWEVLGHKSRSKRKLVRVLPTACAIMRTTFKIKAFKGRGKGHPVDRCWDRSEVKSSEQKGLQTSYSICMICVPEI